MADADINQELENIKLRNRRVELDKAWETSWARRLFIAVITYIAAGVWLIWIKDTSPLLKALIPAAAYLRNVIRN